MTKDNDPADRILRDVFGDKSPEPRREAPSPPVQDTRKEHYIKALREAKEIVEAVMGQSSDTIVKASLLAQVAQKFLDEPLPVIAAPAGPVTCPHLTDPHLDEAEWHASCKIIGKACPHLLVALQRSPFGGYGQCVHYVMHGLVQQGQQTRGDGDTKGGGSN